MSDGAGTALLVVGLGVGGYALYRLLKRDTGRHLAGAGCGPMEYWDDVHKSCVPLALPQPPTMPTPQCPPGFFWDYLRQSCVTSSPARTGWDY